MSIMAFALVGIMSVQGVSSLALEKPTKPVKPTESTAPTQSPSPSIAPTPESTNPPTPIASPSPSATPSAAPTQTPKVTPSAAPTQTPKATPSATPTQTPKVTPTATPTQTPKVTKTPTPSPSDNCVPGQENLPPVAENYEFETYRDVCFTAQLCATDPEGDSLTFEITTSPRKGTVELNENGCFVYTPAPGKKGKDYFGYRAIDAQGNASQEATVIIRIKKQKARITYSDMSGNGNEYAALVMAEKDIFTGSYLGGTHVFEPARTVNRGEFLAMCLKMADVDVLSGVTRTGFSDDTEIPMWVKPYVSTALISGVISGYAAEGATPVFQSETPITPSEAAVILDKVLGITDVPLTSAVMAEDAVPTWAMQATANLQACKIVSKTAESFGSDVLTRAEAAQMMLQASNLLKQR